MAAQSKPARSMISNVHARVKRQYKSHGSDALYQRQLVAEPYKYKNILLVVDSKSRAPRTKKEADDTQDIEVWEPTTIHVQGESYFSASEIGHFQSDFVDYFGVDCIDESTLLLPFADVETEPDHEGAEVANDAPGF
ncbi:hypothetical protein AMS68_000873 [Peltaster fructicola]|uniref:Uncharacterized protein n=1 Tax=Peltaster fructicola TaxID=286661 RepID=A0A6H0XKW7_9PEZI|nr:hypothetical protein AMS68_000873 [Peltaster fructicola]